MRWALLIVACASLPGLSARAAESAVAGEHRAQVESVRAEVAAQIQLQAYDLLDDLVFGWTRTPPFDAETHVVLAHVGVPVGFGSGLEALIENHLISLLVKYPATRVVVSHCPQCTSVLVHSGAQGTVVSRGFDDPRALADGGALSGSRHALFLDFEAEGAALVLRARITALEPALPIVYAKTLSASTTSAALLRSPDRLKSASDARQEYLDVLEGRSTFTVPLRVGVRTYATSGEVRSGPFVWLQGGVEMSFTQARAWLGSFSLGGTWTSSTHKGWMAEARLSRLVSGNVASLTRPDLYFFVGGSVISIYGNDALVFQDKALTVDDLVAQAKGAPSDPHAFFPAFQVGLELRVKNRIALGAFLESLPTVGDSRQLGNYLDVGVRFQSIGVEVSFCF